MPLEGGLQFLILMKISEQHRPSLLWCAFDHVPCLLLCALDYLLCPLYAAGRHIWFIVLPSNSNCFPNLWAHIFHHQCHFAGSCAALYSPWLVLFTCLTHSRLIQHTLILWQRPLFQFLPISLLLLCWHLYYLVVSVIWFIDIFLLFTVHTVFALSKNTGSQFSFSPSLC